MQKVKKTMPSRTGIPPDAQAEILQKLSAETKITSCEIAEILKKHDVCGDMAVSYTHLTLPTNREV